MCSLLFHMSLAQFLVQKVTPQSDGSSSKVKVKVRVNVHGIFSVSSASLVEVLKFEENEEPMETDQNAKEEEVIWTFYTILVHLRWYRGDLSRNSNKLGGKGGGPCGRAAESGFALCPLIPATGELAEGLYAVVLMEMEYSLASLFRLLELFLILTTEECSES